MQSNSMETTVAADDGSLTALLEGVAELMRRNRARRDPDLDRRILRQRHLAGIRLLQEAPGGAEYATPSFEALPEGSNPPEVSADALTPELLRGAILRHGCLLVRGLIDRDAALGLAGGIQRAFDARAALAANESAPEGLYEEFTPEPPFKPTKRQWVAMAGGLLAADSPPLMFEVLDALERARFLDVVHGYLGERAALSVEKTTLRKAEPQVAGGWHQDGSFLGTVRPLNLWLALSRCGDEAPGLDILPRRLDRVLPAGGEGTNFPIQIHDSDVAEAAAGVRIVRPIFEPGDALVFDELFLHKTGSDPEMPKARYALESWFFGASSFTSEYTPLAV